jgi:hypothetical protein
MNLQNLNVSELNFQETFSIDGGWYILRITGIFDGIKGNTEFDWFNFD